MSAIDDGSSGFSRADHGLEVVGARFSSENWNPQERTDAVQHLMAPLYKVDPINKDVPLTANMDISMLQGMIFSKTEFFNHQCLRDPSRARIANFDSLLVQLFDHGSIFGDIDGEPFEVEQGGVVVFDLSKPYQFRAATSKINRCLNIVVPRFMVDALGQGVSHGKVLSPANPITQLVASHIRTLNTVLRELDPAEFFAAQQMTIDVLNSGLSLHAGVNKAKETSLKNTICSYVYMNCHDDLSIDSLAERFKVSRATLFRIFSEDGGVSSYVKNIRLERCLRDLIKSDASSSVEELAVKWGFSSNQQFLRLFKNRFNCTPSQARAGLDSKNYFESGVELYSHMAQSGNPRKIECGTWL